MIVASKPARLGDWLLNGGHVTQTQLDLALREQKRKGGMLGEVLADLGFVTQETLASFLAQKTQTEQVDLSNLALLPEILRLVPEALAHAHTAVPVSLENGVLTVAIADPLNVMAFDALERAAKTRVNLVAATEADILTAIDRQYASGHSIEELVDDLLKLGDKLATTTEQDAPMIRLVDRIIAEAIHSGSSDIHVQPEEKILRVRFRKDGVLQAGLLIPKAIQPALTARFKILGRMDITENRKPQGGRATVSSGGRDIGLRLSSLPTAFGESLVLRVLDRSGLGSDLKSFGFAPDMERRFCDLLDRPHGIILVTGPTGSGKTTTLYTALGRINGIEKSIFTLEDPVEYRLPLVRQTQINETVGLTFAEGLRTLLRQDPDVILVGETRDTETAQLAVRAALTGHLVFSTLHTNDALGAIPRLIDLGVEPYLLAPTLVGVLGQRLVRVLCPKCRVPIENAAALLADLKADLPTDLPPNLWRPEGCSECQRTGYRGRTGIFELVTLDPGCHSAITNPSGVDAPRLRELAHTTGFRTMFEDGVHKAMRGVTTLEEIFRVTQR